MHIKFTFFLILISLAAGNLFSQELSPVNPKINQVVPSASIDFKWNLHPDADMYHITIASDYLLQTVLHENDVITNMATYSVADEDTCYWTIAAVDGTETIMVSDTFMFVVFFPPVFPGIQVWLNGDDVITDGSNKVATWSDKSNNGLNFTQEDDAKKPVLISNGLNDFPALQFDGNDFLNGGDVLDVGYSNAWSMFVVGKSSSSEGSFIAKSVAAGVPNRWGLFYEGSSLVWLYIDPSSYVYYANAPISQYHLINTHANRIDHTLKYRIDGVLKNESNTIAYNTYNFNSPYRCLIGGYSNSSDNGEIYYLNGNISEIIIYNSLSDAQALFVENMLRYKYYPSLYKEPVSLGFDILITDNFCDTTLDAGAGFSGYIWSTGETTQTISVNQKGYYSVTATDSYGVTSSDIIYVSYPEIGYSFADTTICAGDEIVWETGLGSFYNEWNTGYIGGSALTIGGPFAEGNYSVTVYDLSGCWADSDIINVQVDNFPNQILLGNDRDECYGTNIGLISPPSGIVSYLWNDGTTSSVIPATESGDYHVTVTNNRGCQGVDTVNINISGYAPVVDFDADTACLGEETHFTNLTTITPPFEISEWSWDFGDSETSTEENPVHIYDAPGVYLVQLHASTDAGCNNFIQQEVLVLPNPEAIFSVNLGLHHCLNSEVSFINEATDPEIVAWQWDFGDGSESLEQNPQHTFQVAGVYEVWLKLTNINGCSDSVSHLLQIDSDFLYPGSFFNSSPLPGAYFYNSVPLVDFSWTPSADALYYRIEISTDENFENIYASDDIMGTEYSRTFADTSTYYWRVKALNMCNDYSITAADSFFVKKFSNTDISFWLDASEKVGLNGDKVTTWQDKSTNDYIGLQPIELFQPTLLPADSLINNKSAVRFENQYINFGGILPLDSIRDYYMFVKYEDYINFGFVMSKGLTGEGSFSVSNDEDTCLMRLYYDNTITTTEYCMPEDAYFLLNVRMHPLENIEFYQNLLKVYDVDISVDLSGENLFDLIIGNSQYGSFSYPLKGEIAEIIVFDTLLDFSNRIDLINYFHNKYAPPVNLGRDINISYTFCDTTIIAEKPWFIKYEWNTGASTPFVTINAMQSGLYSVTVTDIFGVTSTDEIEVSFPIVNQGLSDSTICNGNIIQWQAVQNDDYTYQWYGNPSSDYYIDIFEEGSYAYIVTDSLGCKYYSDTVEVSISYFASEASFGSNDTSLCIGNRLTLAIGADEALTYHWNDESTGPYIIIDESGEYSITVTSIYGCIAQDTINVSIQGTAPVADFNILGFCENNEISFNDQSQAMSGNLTNWQWSIDGVIVAENQNFIHIFDTAGVYIVELTVENSDECSNYLNQAVTIRHLPEPDFSPDIACSATLVVFYDNSNAVEGEISSVWWNFDGTYSIQGDHALYEFEEDGLQPVKIKVENSFGCTDSLTMQVNVKPSPVAEFTNTPACQGNMVYFNNLSTSPFPWDITHYNWSFGDGNTANISSPSNEFTDAGEYEVMMWVKALNGCSDTITQTLTVHPVPIADFNNLEFCLLQAQEINDNSSVASGNIVSWEYTVSSIGVYNEANPEVVFNETGTYETILSITTDAGCFDSETKNITVYPLPVAIFTPDAEWGAVPLEVSFANESTGALSYHWDFGDDEISTLTEPTYTFENSGIYEIQLVAVSDHGCTDTTTTSINVIVPILDLVLLNQVSDIENDYLISSIDIINAGTLPFSEIDLVISVSQNIIFREKAIGPFLPGSVTNYTLSTNIYLNSNSMPDYVCIEGIITEYPEYDDINLENQILCNFDSDQMVVFMPFPNPAQNTVYLDVLKTDENSFEIEIYNSLGSKIYTSIVSDLPERNYRISLDVSTFSSGLYNLVIKQGGNYFSRQFVKL